MNKPISMARSVAGLLRMIAVFTLLLSIVACGGGDTSPLSPPPPPPAAILVATELNIIIGELKGLSFHAPTNTLYGAMSGVDDALVSVDVSTAEVTVIGPTSGSHGKLGFRGLAVR